MVSAGLYPLCLFHLKVLAFFAARPAVNFTIFGLILTSVDSTRKSKRSRPHKAISLVWEW